MRVVGKPRLELIIGTRSRQAVYDSTTTADQFVYFTYQVEASDLDTDGISIRANALRLAGGVIVAGSSTTNAVLTHDAVPDATAHKVNGALTAPPRVRSLRFWGSPANGRAYGLDERILVEVLFDKEVEVTGGPRLGLVVGARSQEAVYLAPGLTGALDETLERHFFEYAVELSDYDADGVSIPG